MSAVNGSDSNHIININDIEQLISNNSDNDSDNESSLNSRTSLVALDSLEQREEQQQPVNEAQAQVQQDGSDIQIENENDGGNIHDRRIQELEQVDSDIGMFLVTLLCVGILWSFRIYTDSLDRNTY